jgi:hypothetical protein
VFAVPNVSSAAAAETDSEDIGKPTTATSETNKPQDSNDKQAETNKDTNGKAKNREIFRPSEEISEDFAVSFPVDI